MGKAFLVGQWVVEGSPLSHIVQEGGKDVRRHKNKKDKNSGRRGGGEWKDGDACTS